MIADQLSRSVHFDENYLFILSKATNINTKHHCKQWKLMCRQQILIWTGRCIITNYKHTKICLGISSISEDFDMTIVCKVKCFLKW